MRLLALLGGQAIALGLTVAFLVVPASAVFLHAFGAGALAYAYIVVAVVGVGVSSALTVAQRRMPLGRLALVVIATHVVVVAVSWFLLSRWDLTWVTFVLIVLFPVSIPTGFLLVGSQAVRLYDVQTLKRDFPRVVAGFSVGFAIGGLAAAALVEPVGGATNLLLIDVVMALAMMGLVQATNRQFPGQLLAAPTAGPARGEGRRRAPRIGELRLLKDPLVLLVLGYQILSAAVTQLLDYVVWERAAAYYKDPESLAQFMGAFGAIINISAVLFVLLVAGRLLSRRGIGFGLLANPVGVIVLTIAVIGVGFGPGIATFAYLVAVCAAQVVDITLTDGTTRTSIAATYQGIRRGDRLRAQTFIEGAGVPLAVGLVGAFLLLIRALGLDVRAVVWTTVALSVVWMLVAVKAQRSYAGHLGGVLADRSWDPVALRIDDATAAAVDRLLSSADAVDRRTGLDVLVDARSPRLVAAATKALSDPDPSVRSAAVEALARLDATRRPEVESHVGSLLGDSDAGVRARAGAAVSRASDSRSEDGYRVWRAVLDDDATAGEALAAAATVPSEALVPDLIRLVGVAPPPPGLPDALSANGGRLVEEFERLVSADGRGPALVTVATALARGAGDHGRDVLLEALGHPRREVAEAAALGLAKVSALGNVQAIDARARKAVGTAAERELERARLVVDALAVLDAGNHVPGNRVAGPGDAVAEQGDPVADAGLLVAALEDELVESSRRLLTLVGIVVPGVSPARVIAGLGSTDDATRGLAEELVVVAVGRQADRVMAVVTPGLSAAERRARLGGPKDAGQAGVATTGDSRPGDSAAEVVRSIALDADGQWRDPWLRACALRVLPTLAPETVDDMVRAAGEWQPDPVLVETVGWLRQVEASRASR
jgi:hypothetical protein